MGHETAVSFALLIARLGLGTVIFAHGAQKVMGWFGGQGLEKTRDVFVTYMKIPPPLFYVLAFTEFLGGIGILLGIFTRLAGLGIFIAMTVATLKVHRPAGFFLSSDGKGGQGMEFTIVLAAVALALCFAGPGSFSIEGFIMTR